ncbi:Phosphatidylinositide phosphatase SAC1 [Smittium culicis]|uniref:Phosphatidylinositide phosphatase SAC1 n=1 Tax=Smittium culicis TaxID=133412 RepID=A0A1R1WY16_9FUNG|nr:Phosphatidylinositide phosphatase SAC1 [Smittium culicis]
MDVTSSIQRQFQTDPELPLHKKANMEFFYNYHLSKSLINSAEHQPEISLIILPIINGCTRYFSRGVDDDGNVSNYAETEQIVEIGKTGNDVFKSSYGKIISYLQLRGSIPIKWTQIINGKYKPSLEYNLKNSDGGFIKHMDKLVNDYQRCVMVNLVDKVKYEKGIGEAFTQISGNSIGSRAVEYYHFDFHKECSKMRFNRVSLLIDKIKNLIDSYQSFEYNPNISPKPTKLQSGIIRTNCMDCLDRTNVVQSILASDWLVKEFREMNILGADETFKNYDRVTNSLRNMWADNADYVSLAYSGTGALKTDFTRTGKRTKLGLLSDGYNSLERYYKNNFSDGTRQDSIDLFLGYYKVDLNSSINHQHLRLFSINTIVRIVALLFASVYGMKILIEKHASDLLSWPVLVEYEYRPIPIVVNSSLEVPFLTKYVDMGISKVKGSLLKSKPGASEEKSREKTE